MKTVTPFLLLFLFALSAQAQPLQVEPAFPDLAFAQPTDLQTPPDGTDRLFVLEKAGVIRVFDNDPQEDGAAVFMDITGRVDDRSEGGLLGLAFHPDFSSNGRFFVNYTAGGPFRTVIAEFDANAADVAASEQVLLEVDQPFGNHNAGQIQFGPDGTLYVALGDGGSGGDPENNGQDPSTLLGSMLRLGVDGGGSAPDCGGLDAGYTVPSDNPFLDDDAACDEIFAYGFRNPFRFSFGPEGLLFAGDVGQNEREEIDVVRSGQNYGWNEVEGTQCYPEGSTCDLDAFAAPIIDYGHDEDPGGQSVTGGYVYANAETGCASLQDRYVYGDFVSGTIWSLAYDAQGELVDNRVEVEDSGLSISTFGRDASGEVLIADISGGDLYRFSCERLPVELTDFGAAADGIGVLLSWQTASETANAGFAIEQQIGGVFEEIAFVDGAGTTTNPQRYTHRVADLAPGTYTFRLRQVDLDGTATFSETVRVVVTPARFAMQPVAPNPVRTEATLTFVSRDGAPVTAVLYDMLGRRVRTLYDGTPAPGVLEQVPLRAADLPPGRYAVRVKSGTFSETQAVTVVR